MMNVVVIIGIKLKVATVVIKILLVVDDGVCMHTFLLILYRAVCLPLSARYGAVEMTTIRSSSSSSSSIHSSSFSSFSSSSASSSSSSSSLSS